MSKELVGDFNPQRAADIGCVETLVPGIRRSDAELITHLVHIVRRTGTSDTVLWALDIAASHRGYQAKMEADVLDKNSSPIRRSAVEVAGSLYRNGLAYRITTNFNLPEIAQGVVALGTEARETVVGNSEFVRRSVTRNEAPHDHDVFQYAQNAMLATLAQVVVRASTAETAIVG